MLETLRSYGIQRLRDRGQYDPARRRHAELFAAIAEAGGPALYGPEHLEWLRRIEEELENLRAAVHNAIAIGDADIAVRMAGALGFFFAVTERHATGRGWLETALAAADDRVPPLARARALSYLGYLEGQQGDFDPGIRHAELGLSLAVASGDTFQTAGSRLTLALVLGEARRYERVPALLAQAKAGYDTIAEPRADWGVASCQMIAAEAAARANDLEAAERANREVLACSRRIGHGLFEAWSRLLAAWIAERRGDLAAATAEGQAALELLRRLGLSHYVTFTLALLGRFSMRSGNLDQALALQTEAADMVDATASPWFASFAHHCLALTLQRTGRADAEPVFRQAVAESPTAAGSEFSALFHMIIGGSPAARSLIALGAIALSRGDLADAERLQVEGLQRAEREADTAAIGLGLEGIAATAAAAGEAQRAATLLGAAEAVRTAARQPRDRFEVEDADRTKALAGSVIESVLLERLIARGGELPIEQALASARRT
jgi:tetratricopeptide (TPR) repeat protein